MAGKVAKLVFPHNVGPNGDGFHTSRTTKVMRNMEEDDILNQLSDSNFSRRAEILDQLRNAARKNGGRLPFQDQKAIFRGFAMALADNDWDVRHHCIQLVHELIPHLMDELDECMGLILPRLVPNMGDSKITIRRAVIQTLHVYMKHTYDMQQTFKAIVQYGLENSQSRVRKEVIIALPMMFTPEFSEEDFFDIAQSLAKKLLDTSDESIQQHALLSLEKIRNLVGDKKFHMYTQRLSPPLRKYYNKLTGRTDGDIPYSTSSNSTANDVATFKPGDSAVFTPSVDNYTGNGASPQSTRIHVPSGGKFEFGVIPSHILERLKENNFRDRAQAVEELKCVLKDMNDTNVQKMSPHVLSFINYLTSLLDDSNFKITTVTLEILGLLVKRQGPSITAHLKALVGALSKRMGDNKIVIRQAIMKVVMQLMQVLSPKYVLSVICENLSNRNSRVRQETLNIVIASLLTFPSYDFDLAELCDIVAPTLIDPKRQVRQAALECYAAIASNLGPGKLQPLVSSVDSVELSYEGDGVMAAVQARLARRILPKLNADGLVDYATPVPSSAGSRGGSVNLPPGADIEWILSASGGTSGSARSVRSDIDIESVTSSARTTPAPPPLGESPSHGPTPRRSSGRGKGRLPWEESEVTSFENGYSNQPTNKLPRQKQLANSSSNSRDQSPDTGSYRQMYLQQKHKKQSSEQSAVQPFSMYNASREDENHSAFSTPRNNDDSSRMTFPSNSWPDDPGKSNKRLLEPITDADNEPGESEHSPIPTKPTLARGTSSRASSKRKVPPIPVNDKKTERQDSTDSARGSALDDHSDDSNRDEMQQSLRQIRNSATRKKVDKIFDVLNTQHKKMQVSRSPSPPDTFAESGIYSNASTMRSNLDEPDHANPTPVKKGSNTPRHLPRDVNIHIKPRIHHVKSHDRPERKNKPVTKAMNNIGYQVTVSESGLPLKKNDSNASMKAGEGKCYSFQNQKMRKDDTISEQGLQKVGMSTEANVRWRSTAGKKQQAKATQNVRKDGIVNEQGLLKVGSSTEANVHCSSRGDKKEQAKASMKLVFGSSKSREKVRITRFPSKLPVWKKKLPHAPNVLDVFAVEDYDKWRNRILANRSVENETRNKSLSQNTGQHSEFHGKKILPAITNAQSLDGHISEKRDVQKAVQTLCDNVKSETVFYKGNECMNSHTTAKYSHEYDQPKNFSRYMIYNTTSKLDGNDTIRSCTKLINQIPSKYEGHTDNDEEYGRNTRKESESKQVYAKGIKSSLPESQGYILKPLKHEGHINIDKVTGSKMAKKTASKLNDAAETKSPSPRTRVHFPSINKKISKIKITKEEIIEHCPLGSQRSRNRKLKDYCTCEDGALVEFHWWDPFSPQWRRDRIGCYLKSSPRVPRYTDIFRKYKAGQVQVCMWHPHTTIHEIFEETIPNEKLRSEENQRMSVKTATCKNNQIKKPVCKPSDKAAKPTVIKKAKAVKPLKNVHCKQALPPLKNSYSSQREDRGQLDVEKSRKIVLKSLKNKFYNEVVPTENCFVRTRPEEEQYYQTFSPRFHNYELDDASEYISNISEDVEENLKKAENPFESKPRLARKPSQSKSDREVSKPGKDSKSNTSLASTSVAQIDFSPHGGVTFKENPGVNLQMVGMGIEHDNQPAKAVKPTGYGAKARERRRATKDMKSSSSSSTSVSSQQSSSGSQSSEEVTPTASPTKGHVVVGHGMFDGPAVASGSEQAVGTPPDRREKRVSHVKPPPHETEAPQGLGGVYGVSVRQNSLDKEDGDEEDDDVNSIAISQATRANMQLKVQQKKEEAERQRQEKERLRLRELEDKRRKQEAEIQHEKERQQLRLRRLSDQADADLSGLAVSGSSSQQTLNNGQAPTTYSNPAPKPPATKPANATPVNKRKVKPVAEEKSPSIGSAKSSSEPESPDQLKPFKEPQKALDEAMKGLSQEEWVIKCSAINSIRRLAAHHPEVLCTSQLHTLNLAMITEVKNLRSQVSRLAIICVGEMFHKLRKHMEADLDQMAGVLLARAGESNNFIRDDMDQALRYMVDSLTAQRAMLALIVGGASHRNAVVRKTTSYFLVPVVEKMGPGRILSGVKDVTDRILPVAANFLMDGNPETRYNGSKIFHMLMSHEDFDRVLNKHLPQSTLRNISDKLENLKRKGLQEPPSENGSARNRRSGHGSRINSSVRYNSASTGGTDSTPTSSKHRSAMPRTDESTNEEIKAYCSQMTANDWRERQNGITRMHEMITRNPALVGANIVKVFDKFVPCLKDSNSKVNLFALQTMEEVTRALAEYMGSVINYTIQTVASNLSSKNKDIYEAACTVLDSFMNTLDETILLQPFCNQAQSGNSRIKPDMVDRVAYLVTCVYSSRPRQVVLHVLPLLWHLLGTVTQSGATPGGTGNLRISTNHLVHALLSQMGDSLVEHAKNQSSVTPRMTQCLQDMIDNPTLDD